MSNFYLDSIKDEAKVMIDLYSQEEQPVVDIIMCSMRPELIGRYNNVTLAEVEL